MHALLDTSESVYCKSLKGTLALAFSIWIYAPTKSTWHHELVWLENLHFFSWIRIIQIFPDHSAVAHRICNLITLCLGHKTRWKSYQLLIKRSKKCRLIWIGPIVSNPWFKWRDNNEWMRCSRVVITALDCNAKSDQSRVQSQQPSVQWNLRGGRCSSVNHTK